ncbi:hypothetical protein [Flavobacterium phycosphaerae]|uniref:hypothetical protein n=1 Tax=Flavobacterium phycosphaerae TaxID=2697515 RepID=UPI001389BE26|nr:hypothetical protein [Flavobacterium phycosphaerae]
MEKKEAIRLYNFSDGTLVTKGLEIVAFMQRDAVQFDDYGITAAKVGALKDSINVFADTVTDIEALGDQMQSTALKDAKAETLRDAIRDAMARVVLTYDASSAKYRKFGTDTLSHQLDSDLLITAKRVVRVATELMPSLTPNGLTTAHLDTITTLSNEFSDLIVEQKVEIGDRDILQEDRVEAGNEIYNVMIKYSKLGQSIWQTSDVAKYNDYVIYNTISGDPEETPPTP